jgi:hypothetical protein
MNCHAFRKYIGAFADGELEVNENLQALDHLGMCPDCARKVVAVDQLRDALRRVYGMATAPQHVSDLVGRAVEAAQGEATDEFADPPGITALLIRLRRVLIPLGIAASILLAVTASRYLRHERPMPGAVTVVTGRAVADIKDQHRECLLRRHDRRHMFRPTFGLRSAAIQLGNELKINVLAPELTSFGFEFVSAGSCGVRGHRGSHFKYAAIPTGAPLSVFSLFRIDGLGGDAVTTQNDLEYFVSSDDELTVVAWHEGRQTYAFCGPVSEPQMLGLIDGVRVSGTFQPAGGAPRASLTAFRSPPECLEAD